MRRIRSLSILLALGLILGLALGGCAAPTDSDVSADETVNVALDPPSEFGPVYAIGEVDDPVVARTLEGAETTGSPAVAAEIRGYLVDWVHEATDTTRIREIAVMKDGGMYELRTWSRPAAAFNSIPPARLEPESAEEAAAREAAVAIADAYVRETDPEMSGAPVVYNYLIRIYRADNTTVDVWVDPDVGNGRFFYGIDLAPIGS